ncbi:MAG: acetyltransferase [Bacilli bacterium]|jgi:peptidoglycan/LPS O-acetylase OafA/YrhL|nr:acetyltransferase [Bacilli bacterium]
MKSIKREKLEASTSKHFYIKSLDGLRALSVIGVVLYHLFPTKVQGGYLGVSVFFVLSGYLITDILCQEYLKKGTINIIGFYLRRIKRLYPAIIALFIFTSIYIMFFDHNVMNNLKEIVISSLTYTNNWWQIINGGSYFNKFAYESPFTHLWSLAVEGQFYLLWPFLFLLLIKLGKRRMNIAKVLVVLSLISMLIMIILYHPNLDPTRIYYGTDTRVFSLFIGCALAFVCPSKKFQHVRYKKSNIVLEIIGLICLILMILVFIFLNSKMSFVFYGGMYLFSIIIAILMASLLNPHLLLYKVIGNPLFTYLGKRSYSIYLWQFPIMIFFDDKFNLISHNNIYLIIIQIILIILISELSYTFIERKFQKYNYQNLINDLRNYFSKPIFSFIRVKGYLYVVIIALALTSIILAPSQQISSNLKEMENKIEANEKNALKMNDAIFERKPIVYSKTKLGKRYSLTDKQLKEARKMPLSAFGDSVMLANQTNLRELFPNLIMDAKVGRQEYDSVDALIAMKNKYGLSKNIIISLGTNGPFTSAQFDEFMKAIGSNHEVYWLSVHVPTRDWESSVNKLLKKKERQYSNLHIIDWYQTSKNKTSWFYDDNVHPNNTGSIQYTKMVAAAILKEYK